MMQTKMKNLDISSSPKKTTNSAVGKDREVDDWELRPGGMLVQKRDPSSDRGSVPPAPTIRVRVKHGSAYHEIYVNSQASFGELKKLLAAPTGIHPQDQKLFFKDKERDSKVYLDVVGVKERSKIVLVEDATSTERRYLEMRKTAKMEKAAKSISEISLEVDKFAHQVSALDSVISKGGKVAENDVLNLIECLMTQLLKLDGIIADGDVKLQRRMQVKRVQKYVETLDLLKIRNGMSSNNGSQTPRQRNDMTNNKTPIQYDRHAANMQIPKSTQVHQQQQQRQSPGGSVLVTTQWETFDPTPPLIPYTSNTNGTTTPANKLNWELFE